MKRRHAFLIALALVVIIGAFAVMTKSAASQNLAEPTADSNA